MIDLAGRPNASTARAGVTASPGMESTKLALWVAGLKSRMSISQCHGARPPGSGPTEPMAIAPWVSSVTLDASPYSAIPLRR